MRCSSEIPKPSEYPARLMFGSSKLFSRGRFQELWIEEKSGASFYTRQLFVRRPQSKTVIVLANKIVYRVDNGQELSRPQDAGKRMFLHEMMLTDKTEDGQTKQVSEQKLIAKWSSSNKY